MQSERLIKYEVEINNIGAFSGTLRRKLPVEFVENEYFLGEYGWAAKHTH